MRLSVIRDLVKSSPFIPFTMKLVDGIKLDVRHPEIISITRDSIYLHSMDAMVLQIIDPIHVQSIEITGTGNTNLPPNFRPRRDDEFGEQNEA